MVHHQIEKQEHSAQRLTDELNMMKFPASGKLLYSVAIVSDTHLNRDESDTDAAFAVNRLANQRLSHVIDDLNTRDVAAVFHLGDVVHPVPSRLDLYEPACERFHEQAARLKHPLHLIPGNHDVGDKPMPWSPAGTVRQSFIDAWSRCFGAHYFCFSHQGAAFIGINAQVFGSDLELEDEQRDWLEDKLAAHADERIFLLSHYPPFLLSEDEAEHYDNLGDRGRAQILNAINAHPVEALFAGHVHHFWLNRHGDCFCYLLPSTAFTRQDYSEMFRIAPESDFGRNDRAKLGYLLVHIYEQGHEIEFVRYSQFVNRTVGRGYSGSASRLNSRCLRSEFAPVIGFDLRYDWHELVQIPPSGALDEFDRKTVRNDYALLALWEMQVQRLRIPATDLLDASRRARLEDLARLGFRFALYSYLSHGCAISEAVAAHAHLVESWEITGEAKPCARRCLELKADNALSSVRMFYSPVRRRPRTLGANEKYYHVINHGFCAGDLDNGIEQALGPIAGSAFEGIVIRCGMSDSIEQVMKVAAAVESESGMAVSIQLRLRGENPAEHQASDPALCNRIAQAMTLAWCHGIGRVYCDTLADSDRGYFPRVGLVDRLYNPKSGSLIVKGLHALQHMAGAVADFKVTRSEGSILKIECAARHGDVTVMPDVGAAERERLAADACDSAGQWLDWNAGILTSAMPDGDGMPLIRSNVHRRTQ